MCRMYVRSDKLREFMEKEKLTKDKFAKELQTSTEEIEKLLNGEGVEYATAEKFINHLGAYAAIRLIDIDKTGIADKLRKGKL